jgi:hypothetical protein
MDDVRKAVFTELATRKPIDNYRRNLQKAYVERVGALLAPAAPAASGGGFMMMMGGSGGDPKKSDIPSLLKGTLRSLKAEVAAAIPAYSDRMTRYHLQDLNERIEKILNPK